MNDSYALPFFRERQEYKPLYAVGTTALVFEYVHNSEIFQKEISLEEIYSMDEFKDSNIQVMLNKNFALITKNDKKKYFVRKSKTDFSEKMVSFLLDKDIIVRKCHNHSILIQPYFTKSLSEINVNETIVVKLSKYLKDMQEKCDTIWENHEKTHDYGQRRRKIEVKFEKIYFMGNLLLEEKEFKIFTKFFIEFFQGFDSLLASFKLKLIHCKLSLKNILLDENEGFHLTSLDKICYSQKHFSLIYLKKELGAHLWQKFLDAYEENDQKVICENCVDVCYLLDQLEELTVQWKLFIKASKTEENMIFKNKMLEILYQIFKCTSSSTFDQKVNLIRNLELLANKLFSHISFEKNKKINFVPSMWVSFPDQGWGYVEKIMKEWFHNESSKNFFFSSVEDAFLISMQNDQIMDSWSGFTHNVPHKKEYQEKKQLFLDKFISSGVIENNPNCKMLMSLYDEGKEFLTKKLSIPIGRIDYPICPPEKLFNFDILRKIDDIKVVFSGSFMRNFQNFSDLNLPNGFKKFFLKAPPKGIKLDESCSIIQELNREKYEELITNSLLYLNMIYAAGTTVVLESISRCIPIILNRLPAFEDYLGKNYPLFYESKEQAEALFCNRETLKSGFEYLCDLNKRNLFPETFLRSLSKTSYFLCCPECDDICMITILLISYNRIENIPIILDALLKQDFKNFKIILWNNNIAFKNSFERIVNKYESKFKNFAFIESSENYYCIVRSAVATLIDSPYFFLLDDDVIPQPQMLSRFMSKINQCKKPEKTVLCVRGIEFIHYDVHLNFNQDSTKVWDEWMGMKFYDQKAEERKIHFFHADCCFIPTSLFREALKFPMPDQSFVLVDDYWYSFIFGHYLDAIVKKIKGDDLIVLHESGEDPCIALHKNPKVIQTRNRMYSYHMTLGWPLNEQPPNRISDVEEKICESVHFKKKRIWKEGFGGFNGHFEISPQDLDFCKLKKIQVMKVGTVNLGMELKYNKSTLNKMDVFLLRLKFFLETYLRKEIFVVLGFANVPGCCHDENGVKFFDLLDSQQTQEDLYTFWMEVVKLVRVYPHVIGYNLLNEPSIDDHSRMEKLLEIYENLITNISKLDQETPIILEFNNNFSYGGDEEIVKRFKNHQNVIFSFHFYEPWYFSSSKYFENFQYPGSIPKYFNENYIDPVSKYWDKNAIDESFKKYINTIEKYNVPKWRLFLGEFGVNKGAKGSLKYLTDVFDNINHYKLSWSIYSFREKCFDRFNYELNYFENQENPYLDLIMENLNNKPLLSNLYYIKKGFLQSSHLKYEQFLYNFLAYNPNFFGPEFYKNFTTKGRFPKLAWHYNDNVSNSEHIPIIFIIGCGRSGTTVCSKILGVMPEVLVLNEPKFIWMSCDKSFDVWSKKAEKRNGKLDRKYEDLDANQQSQVKKLYFSLASLLGKKMIVDKTPENVFRLDLLRKMFPQSKFINMKRKKEDNVDSIC